MEGAGTLDQGLVGFPARDRIKTPTLFMCGEKDFNVPIAGSEQMCTRRSRAGASTPSSSSTPASIMGS